MKTVVKKLYEAMFLVDSALAASDWDGINKTIETILNKVDAQTVSIQKWDERKLSYEIGGHSRGTYILCYFRAEGTKVRVIEREVQLSERIMRVLILSAESMSQEHIEKETPFMKAERQRRKVVAEEEESPVTQKAEELSQSSTVADEQSLKSVSSVTEQAESEENDEPAAATEAVKNEEDEKEKDAETSP